MSEPYYRQQYQGPRNDKTIPTSAFGQIVKETFLRPFTWDARTTRRNFWIGLVITEIIIWLGGIITFCATIMPVAHYENNTEITGWAFSGVPTILIIGLLIWGIIYIYLKLCQLGLAVRRLHDVDYTGYWLWLLVIPFGWIFILYFVIQPSKQQPVQWGTYLYLDE